MSNDFEQFVTAARRLKPRIAVVLGSGLGELADRLTDDRALPFDAVPGLASPSVVGHHGVLHLGRWAGRPVIVFAGRLHYYEGHPWSRVVRPVHVARELGAEMLLITNAAGGICADLGPGDLMAITAHIAWTDPTAWRQCGTWVSNGYSPRLVELLREAAERAGFALQTGTYAQVTGPTYETLAEIRALRAIGADAVGMSTAPEIDAAVALGMECAAVSCITNKAAGLAAGPIQHEDVLTAAATQRERLSRLIEAFLPTVPSQNSV